MEAVERTFFSLDWVTLTLMFCFLLVVLAKNLYSVRFNDFIMLVFTNKYMMLRGKDHQISHPFNILLFIVNLISIGLFAYICISFFFDVEKEGFILFIQLATAYATFILSKFAIEKIISNIFSIDEIVDYYLFHKISYRNLIALFLLPPIIVFFYGIPPTSIWLYSLVAAALLVNLIVLIDFYLKIQKEILSKWFYFIVYLCALEIAPYIILYKLIT